MKTLSWLAWSVAYWFRPLPRDLEGWLLKTQRTRNPWRKFKPGIFHNDEARLWEITFGREASYVERRSIKVDACIGHDSGRIVGLRIWDETLEA